jgi:chloramphenicol-sensitive protein RarD
MTLQPPSNDRPTLALASALSAYLIWGVVGYYFRIVTHGFGVTPFTLLANRVIWSLVFLLIVLACRRDLGALVAALKTPRLVGPLAISSVLIAINWIVFIYAAATGRLVQASLGYFLTPLVSVLLGVVILREKLRPGQLIAIGIACIGIAPMVYLKFGSVWIPVGLMLSFSLYGLMRKRIVIGPIVGLAVETAILLPAALLFVVIVPAARPTAIGPPAYALLVAAGVITAIPLMLFAYAARRLRLITIGLLQYSGPTVQLIVACLLAGETVSRLELVAFVVIWIGLIVFSIDSVIGYRNRERSAIAAISESPAGAVAASLPSRT